MASNSRPGMPATIQLGGNYAQPSTAPDALPEGGVLERWINWTGEKNCAAPVYDTEPNRGLADLRVLLGDLVVPSAALSEGASAIRRRLTELSLTRLAESPLLDANVRAYLQQWRDLAEE